MKNLLLTGEPGAGKSTLLKRLMADRKVHGFLTLKKEREPDGAWPVFIKPAAGGPEMLAARVRTNGAECFTRVFDGYGAGLLKDLPKDGVAVMDELGYLEDSAAVFKDSVLRVLTEGPHVIGVVKPRSTEFLDAVRSVPDTVLVLVTADKRDELFYELSDLLREWDG